MIESHLVGGRQDLVPGRALTYGQSITDACLGWEAVASARSSGSRAPCARGARAEGAIFASIAREEIQLATQAANAAQDAEKPITSRSGCEAIRNSPPQRVAGWIRPRDVKS